MDIYFDSEIFYLSYQQQCTLFKILPLSYKNTFFQQQKVDNTTNINKWYFKERLVMPMQTQFTKINLIPN